MTVAAWSYRDRAPIGAGERVLRTLVRIRWQLTLGLLLTVGLPALVKAPGTGLSFPAASLYHSLIGTGFAFLGGYVAIRRLALFPGVQIVGLVLSTFMASYGVLVAVFLLTRLDYSRFQVLASFLLAIVFVCLILIVERRVKTLRLAVVPQGDAQKLFAIPGIDWSRWNDFGSFPRSVDGVVADFRSELSPAWEGFLAQCALRGICVYHSKQVLESLTGRVQIEHLSENSLGALNLSSLYARAKRLADLAAALVALPLVVPALALIGIAIRMDDPGPVFFRQPRMGYRGHPFTIWKLRTMRTDCAGRQYTEATDQRVTRVGRLLRRYRIDELPQIVNILKGEMSWIGPRPEAVALSEWYEREIPFYSYRHIVRPGITGWAQLHHGWAALPEEVTYKLHYDFYYIKHFSPAIDILIAVQTIRTVLTGFGAR